MYLQKVMTLMKDLQLSPVKTIAKAIELAGILVKIVLLQGKPI